MATQNLLVKQLIEFGLSEKEARVYLALLELEVAAVSEIAKTADINRSSAYVVLESLKKKGLVSVSWDKKIQNYVAVSPELLLHEAENRAKKAEDLKNKINNILSELKALYKDTKLKPKVRVFEGENGIREAYWSLFTTTIGVKELRTYANPINLFKYVPDFAKHDETRGKMGIKMYAINPATKEMLALYKKVQPHPPYEIALISEEKFRFVADMGIYGNQVAFLNPKEKYGIIIENKDIADTLRNDFDLAWQEAKRLNKEFVKNEKKRR